MAGQERSGWFRATAAFLGWSLVFGLACTQAPLYYSNQNQYFLHGLATAGLGSLDQDWLAGTGDPTPLFSALIALTYRVAHEWAYYIYFVLLLGLYFHSLVGVFAHLANKEDASDSARLLFIALLVAVHSGAARWASVQLFGVDHPWYFQAGVAGQYVLGFGLQPSVFGVLLVCSVLAFLRGQGILAATAAALAAVVHPTYLLAAAFLTLAFMLVTWTNSGSWKRAALLGAWALLLVLPVVVYNIVWFRPTAPAEFAEAQQILVHFRIPHHAVPERWFDGIALGQLLWIVLAMLLVRGTMLFAIMLIPFSLALTLSMAQVLTGNDTLALLFPWRISAVLVPLATAVVLTRLVTGITKWSSRPALAQVLGWMSAVSLGLLVAGGVAINYFGLAYRSNSDELPLLEYVRDHAGPGDVYLLPVDVPRLDAGTKGARSTSFTPPPLRDKDHNLIAIDLQRFRLFTGCPIVIDFKSIPYRDVEVIEWHDRLLTCQKLYRASDWRLPAFKDTLAGYKVSHVVATARQELRCDWLEKIFEDQNRAYRLYRVRH